MHPIESHNPLATSRLGQGLPVGDSARAGRTTAEEAAATGHADLATISNRGRFVASAIQAVVDAPDVRADRVAELQAAIADGTYHSNARAIATRLAAGGTLAEAGA